MKYLYSLIFLLIFCLTSTSQVFENSYSSVPGEVLLIKEFSKSDVAILFKDSRSNTFNISILDEEGQMKRTNSISKIDSLRAFDALYRTDDGYIVSYSIGSPKGASNARYFAQCFDYFNHDLVFESRSRQVFNDTSLMFHSLLYEMNDEHLWVGVKHMVSQPDAIHILLGRFDLNQGKAGYIDHTIQPVKSHTFFVRSFIKPPTVNTGNEHVVWIIYDEKLHQLNYFPLVGIISRDTFDRYTFAEKGDTFTLYFKDVADIVRVSDGYIATVYVTDKNGLSKIAIIRINDDKTILARIISAPESYLQTTELPLSNKGTIALSQNNIFSFLTLDSLNISSNLSVLKYDYALNVIKRYPIFDANIRGNISMIQPSKDGGCYVVGNRKVDSTGTDFMFIAKLDSNNIVSYVSTILPARQNIYPNPGIDFISGIPEQCILKLTDISGRVTTLEPEANHINVSTLNTGIYFYQIINKEGNPVASGKWIKQ